jgi:alkyl hydroperoxide reductase subunit D
MIFEALSPSEKAQKSLHRIKETLHLENLPPGIERLAVAEDALQDISMNLARLMKPGEISEGLKLLIALATAVTQGSPQVTEFFSQAALKAGRTREDVAAAIGVAVGMGTNNAYFRFRYQVTKEDSEALSAFKVNFNLGSLLHSSLPLLERELISIAVSSINNCQGCVKSHVNKAREAGMTNAQLDETIKTLSVAFTMAQVVAALTPPLPSP